MRHGAGGRIPIALALLVLWAGASCTKDYVTGRRTFSLVSESQEIALGKEADPQIISEYGLYDDPKLAEYVDTLGHSLARVSQRSQLDYTFRVLDSPIVNAFALPGGWVYVTRGILANFNSEDELAGVLGHEIGHVVARHGAEQMSRQQLAALGLGVTSMVSETFRKFAQAAGAGIGLLFLSFSRSQESESDLLGVEYSTTLGYDAHKMAHFFQTLDRMRQESGQTLPSFLSTHPDPGDREVRVGQLADEWQHKIAYKPLNLDPYEYLKRIDGIVYGPDPRQGFVDNNVFYHPSMRFKFPVPAGWDLQNSASTVLMLSSDKKAAIQLTAASGKTADEEANKMAQADGVTVIGRRSSVVHGFPAVALESQITVDGNLVRVLSYFIEYSGNVFVFHGYTAAASYAVYEPSFSSTMNGFQEVTNEAILGKKPRRLRLERAPHDGDTASILRSLGVAEEELSEIAILNGRSLDEKMVAGDWVKTVSE